MSIISEKLHESYVLLDSPLSSDHATHVETKESTHTPTRNQVCTCKLDSIT